jgi:cytoskeletal protein CcmA (bactofilin family)
MFSIGRKTAAGGIPARPGSKGANLSFIAPDMVVSGDVSGTGQIHIDGRVDGNVQCEMLIQGHGGTIAGNIVADAAHLAGLVDGTVKARTVTLEQTARVTGDVTYETLSIAAGAAIEGRVSRRQDQPPAAAALEPPAAAESAPAPAPAADPPPKKLAKAPKKEEPGLLAAVDEPAPAAANAR